MASSNGSSSSNNSKLVVVPFLLLVAAVAFVGIMLIPHTAAYAQAAGMKEKTSGKSLDVLVQPTWSDGGQAQFQVSFLKPNSTTVQNHIDYDFVIMNGGKKVFDAAPQGQTTLHTASGTVTIPFKFPNNGDYVANVTVSGINFVPIKTETATFPLKVAPEFPAEAIGSAMAIIIGTTAIVTRKFKVGLKI
jgi:hypothetical protein